MSDADGVPVISLNAAIKSSDTDVAVQVFPPRESRRTAEDPFLPPGAAAALSRHSHTVASAIAATELAPVKNATAPATKWPKEEKPTVLDKVHDIAILQYAAANIFQEEVVGFVTDWKDYFSQFAVAPSQLWLNVVHWSNIEGIDASDLPGPLGSFVSEKRLGFGASSSSNIAQRFAHFISAVFRRAFDREEQEIFMKETDPKRKAYLEARYRLGKDQCRLYELSIYTDDPFFVCIGSDRLVRALRLWHRIMKATGLLSAIPEKRQCGGLLRWLGLDWYLSLGLLVIPTNKRLRALEDLDSIVSGAPMDFAEYRKVTSFLQYLRPFATGVDPSHLYGFYQPFKRDEHGMLPTAASPVSMSSTIKEQASKWISILSSTAGVRFSGCLANTPPPAAKPRMFLYSDAALEGARVPGLGGYLHGYFWSIALKGNELRLPISVLEFVAIGINIMVFAAKTAGAHAFVCSDSLNSIQILNRFSADSPLMQYVHRRILNLRETPLIADESSFVHCFGPANPAADHLSRGEFELFKSFCADLGVAPIQVAIPAAAQALLDDTVVFAQANNLLLPTKSKPRSLDQLQVEKRFGKGFSSDNAGDGPNGVEPLSKKRRRQLLLAYKDVSVYAASPSSTYSVLEDCTESLKAKRRKQLSLAQLRGGAPKDEAEMSASKSNFEQRARRPVNQPCAEPAKALVSQAGLFASPNQAKRGPLRLQTRREARLSAMNSRARELTTLLSSDTSNLALRPQDPSTLLRLVTATLVAAETSPASGTIKADDLAWERWREYCALMRTAPVRSSLLANAGIDLAGAQRETVLLCGFLIHQAETMTGRGGRGQAKPQSAFNMVLAVRRIHARLGCPMEILPGVRRVLAALVKKFIALHGPDAILPRRKEPLDAPRIARILALADGTRISARNTIDWKAPLFRVFKALLCSGFAAAFRKAELIPASCETDVNQYLTRASISWVIKGVPTAYPNAEQLAALQTGDYCVIKPPLLKNDAFGLHFGWK